MKVKNMEWVKFHLESLHNQINNHHSLSIKLKDSTLGTLVTVPTSSKKIQDKFKN